MEEEEGGEGVRKGKKRGHGGIEGEGRRANRARMNEYRTIVSTRRTYRAEIPDLPLEDRAYYSPARACSQPQRR